MNINLVKQIVGKNNRESDRIGIIGENQDYKKYSVAIPLININGELNILLQVRAKHLNNQPGEISFPGGKIEENENSLMAVIRETCEELNISEDSIEILGSMDLMITHHNKIIYPYAIHIDKDTVIKPAENEVDHIFFVPLKFFIETKPLIKVIRILTEPKEEFPYSNMIGAMGYKWIEGRSKIYIYKYEEYIIWGLTAKIMNHFVELITDKN
jgi:8-oxo-dGTP pyrophosphatase MutT (NUDIX family)